MDLREYFYAHLQKLQELLRIPSVYDGVSAVPDRPYGEGVAAALEYMRQLAYQDGFEVLEYDERAIGIRIREDGQEDTEGNCRLTEGKEAAEEEKRRLTEGKEAVAEGRNAAVGKDGSLRASRIDIASHLDVVEPGNGWTVDPFGALILEGKLYGRGTQDMKVSAFLTYLALKRLREEGATFRRELRIVLGGDEERTMEDMIHYVEKAGLPDFAFTPDGIFPMAIGEKGALMWRLAGTYEETFGSAPGTPEDGSGLKAGPESSEIGRKGPGVFRGPVEELDCGVQCNVISPIARAKLRGNHEEELQKAMEEARIEGTAEWIRSLSQENRDGAAEQDQSGTLGTRGGAAAGRSETEGFTLLQVRGRAAHASQPQDGRSATVDLLYLLKNKDLLMENLYQCFRDPYGSQLGVAPSDGEQERFTMNLGVFRMKNGVCYGEVDGRYPFGMDSGELTRRLAEKCALKVSLDYDSPPTMNDEEDVYVSTLLGTYRELTGDDGAPVVSGGVSYSKIFGHCVAFGPVMPGMEKLAHQADEFMELEDCVKVFAIYYEAMKRLAAL